MGVTLKRMLVATHPIASACYYSGFEFYQITVDYFMTIIDYYKLIYNIIHNLGNMYDCVIDLVDVFRFGNPAIRSYYQRIGRNFGEILNNLAYKPRDYDPL